jgi:flagellar protein FlaG
MRISGNSNTDTVINKVTVSDINHTEVKQGSKTSTVSSTVEVGQQQLDNSEETKSKIKGIVEKFNEILEISNNTSKFMYHEGLDKYYVTVVNRDTEEVVKEIPPKKLLDAYYEMKKMLGMIVDEKI